MLRRLPASKPSDRLGIYRPGLGQGVGKGQLEVVSVSDFPFPRHILLYFSTRTAFSRGTPERSLPNHSNALYVPNGTAGASSGPLTRREPGGITIIAAAGEEFFPSRNRARPPWFIQLPRVFLSVSASGMWCTQSDTLLA